ncbi:MAG: ATP synthase F1 subunit delta [Bacteroidetes bacterium]|nr:ATP synthase F1 subunit delta [Bacteroidota bacterium]
MSDTKIARRYATALYLNAKEGEQTALLDEVKYLQKVITENHALSALLKDKSIESSTKITSLKKIFSHSSPIIQNTLVLLCQKRREDILEEVIKEFYEKYDTVNNRVKVSVSSALPLDKTTEQSISDLVKERTGAKEIEFTNTIDKSILGGFVVRFGDTLIDSSIISQLNKIKKEFKIA